MKPELTELHENQQPLLNADWLNCFNSDKNRLVILPLSPVSIFVYWQWTASKTEFFRGNPAQNACVLRLFNAETKTQAAEFKCRWDGLKLYLEPPQETRRYYASLCVIDAGGTAQTLLESNVITLPYGGQAGELEAVWSGTKQ